MWPNSHAWQSDTSSVASALAESLTNIDAILFFQFSSLEEKLWWKKTAETRQPQGWGEESTQHLELIIKKKKHLVLMGH